jgi:hypothetical protein
MEKSRGIFPYHGKLFSTLWKTAAMAAALTAGAVRAEAPGRLALELAGEGRREAAAIEFRRLALAAGDAETAGRWYWLAAQEYAQGRDWEASNRMLDRAEDAAPFALAAPVAWRRAENALGQRDWPAAAFHFDSLRLKGGADDWREFSARGAAAARLRENNLPAARAALAAAPGDPAEARAALEGYAGRRNKRPWLGGVLGLVPGLGYVYSGEYANAARSLILNSLFIWAMVETAEDDEWGLFAVVTFAEFTWYSGSIYGGMDAAHRHNQRRLDAAADAVRGGRRLRPDLGQVPVFSLGFEF